MHLAELLADHPLRAVFFPWVFSLSHGRELWLTGEVV